MKISSPPLIFRFFYKLEISLVLFTVSFFLMLVFTLIITVRTYYDVENVSSKSIIIGKMKVIYIVGAGQKGGSSMVKGFIIGRKNECEDCINVAIGNTSIFMNKRNKVYLDSKYENIEIGDTIPVCYNSNLDFVEIVSSNGLKWLFEHKKQEKREALLFVIKLFLTVFILYVISRKLRKYYQKKYKMTDNEFKQYIKIAFKK